jgi:hypothetical protein
MGGKFCADHCAKFAGGCGSIVLIERLPGNPLLLAWRTVAIVGILDVFRFFFSLDASSPLLLRLLLLPGFSLSLGVGVSVPCHDSSLLILTMDGDPSWMLWSFRMRPATSVV